MRHLSLLNEYVVVRLIHEDAEWVHSSDFCIYVLVRSCKIDASLIAIVKALMLVLHLELHLHVRSLNIHPLGFSEIFSCETCPDL